jgi:CRP-like cAMP-binding protein
MPIDKIVAPLLRVPLFAGLKPLQITEIARQAERLRFRPGQIITKAGASGDGALLVVSGQAACIERTQPLPSPEPVEPGSLIGEIAMLVEHEYSSTIVAQQRVLCLKITRRALHAQMLDDFSLAEHFQQCIAHRLRQVQEQLRQIDGVLAQCGSSPRPEQAAGPLASTGKSAS